MEDGGGWGAGVWGVWWWRGSGDDEVGVGGVGGGGWWVVGGGGGGGGRREELVGGIGVIGHSGVQVSMRSSSNQNSSKSCSVRQGSKINMAATAMDMIELGWSDDSD